MISKTVKFFLKFILTLILGLLLYFIYNYITCPVYEFNESSPFSGKFYYNPYENMDSNNWKKGNFQVQSKAWSGITAGSKNSNELIHQIYSKLGYDIIATSDYQKINYYKKDEVSFIPVYEHGYGIFKIHQILIGANKVLWTDYPFFQSLSNKQHIINLLRPENELIYIAHPALRKAYQPGNMRYLANFDGIEVLNNFISSLKHWDAALSSGNYITILGNDDAHNVSNTYEVGRKCTYINTPSLDRDDIINALKSGNSFGADIYSIHWESLPAKIERTKILPVLKQLLMKGDTIILRMDSVAKKIRFIGQNGVMMETQIETDQATYLFQSVDTYIRIEIEFNNGTTYYLNPVCRIKKGNEPQKADLPEINWYKTYLQRIVGYISIIFIIIIVIRRRVLRKRY